MLMIGHQRLAGLWLGVLCWQMDAFLFYSHQKWDSRSVLNCFIHCDARGKTVEMKCFQGLFIEKCF